MARSNPMSCPDHGVRPRRLCPTCQPYLQAQAQTPISIDQVRRKIRKLRREHFTDIEIARAAEVLPYVITLVMAADSPQKSIRQFNARKIMAITAGSIPEAERVAVDATATHRMLGALALRRHGRSDVAAVLFVHPSTISLWQCKDRVPGLFAARLREHYYATLGTVGPGRPTVMFRARRAGALPDRMWTPENIGDPKYNPLKALKDPTGVQRRLQALARDGHPLGWVAGQLGEDPTVVEMWRSDSSVPQYAGPLVAGLFDRLDGKLGEDRATADAAVRRGWRGSAAWEGWDIDNPKVEPRLPTRFKRRKDDVEVDYVNGAIIGEVPRDELTTAELVIVLRYLAGLGWSAARIAERLKWEPKPQPEEGKSRTGNTVQSFGASHGIRFAGNAQEEKDRRASVAAYDVQHAAA
jgi:hypothetical protein